MKRVANTYWTDNRLSAQHVTERALPDLSPARELSREIIGTRTEVRRRGGLIPSWVIFGMIILATAFLCGAVTMRTSAERGAASAEYEVISSEVRNLSKSNAALKAEVSRLRNNRRAIETAARTRLNMVRTNEYVVPTE